MSIYIQQLILTVIVTFIVDLSGFSDTVLRLASALVHRKVVSLRPLTCALCMTFWSNIALLMITGKMTLLTLGFGCALAYLSTTIGGLLALLRSFIRLMTDKLMTLIDRLYD